MSDKKLDKLVRDAMVAASDYAIRVRVEGGCSPKKAAGIAALNAGLSAMHAQDNERAIACFTEAVDLGEVAALSILADFYLHGVGTDRDEAWGRAVGRMCSKDRR